MFALADGVDCTATLGCGPDGSQSSRALRCDVSRPYAASFTAQRPYC